MEPTAPAAAPMTNTCAISSSTRDAPEPSPSHPRRGGENVATLLLGFELNVWQSGHEACFARTSVFLVSDRSSGAYCKLISLKYTQIRNISKTRASQRMTPPDRGAHFAKRPRTTRPIARDGRHGRSIPGGRGLPAEDQHRWGVGVRATRESRRCVARIALEPILRPSATSRIRPPSRDAPPSPND